MANVVYGNQSSRASHVGDLGYQYLNDLDWRPASKLHEKVLGKLVKRADISHKNLETRRQSWREIDKTLTAYIHVDQAERILKRQDAREPTSIVFPHSYSLLETIVSFLDSVFLKDTLFQYEGAGSEDIIGATLLERVVQQHCEKFKVRLALHTAFKDSLAYGIGVTFPMWKTKFGYKTRTLTDENGVPFRMSTPKVLFEGNALETVDPYLVFLDPNYGVQSVQDSEFIGFLRRTNYYNLLTEDSMDSSTGVFNVKYLKEGSYESRFYEKERNKGKQATDKSADKATLKTVDVMNLYINLVPKDWGLGEGTTPEKWFFAVAGEEVIIQAQPLNLDHDMFPIAVCAPTYDGYSTAPLSRLELVGGMQELLNWLFNSHIANVRKTINDMIIFDPFMINSADLADPKPGKLIRARRSAWGKDIRGSVMQLQVNDVTRQNISDAQMAMSMMNQISGADDSLMGSLRQGGPERLSATEFSGTRSQALGRLTSMSMIIGAQLMQDIGYMFAMHTQQLMTQDLWVKMVGTSQEQLESVYGITNGDRRIVTPQDLDIDFDVRVLESTQDKQSTEFWVQMWREFAAHPELNQTFDLGRIFRHVAVLLGAENVDSFIRQGVQPMTAPTGDVMAQAQAGNLVAVDELGA